MKIMKKSNVLALLILGIMFLLSPCLAAAEEGTSQQEISRGDNLLIKNAIGALWHDDAAIEKINNSAGIDLNAIKAAPAHVFSEIYAEFFENDVWSFEGRVYRMGTREDGIECIVEQQDYIINVEKADNGYRITYIAYDPDL